VEIKKVKGELTAKTWRYQRGLIGCRPAVNTKQRLDLLFDVDLQHKETASGKGLQQLGD
jgi:hypothetical protein